MKNILKKSIFFKTLAASSLLLALFSGSSFAKNKHLVIGIMSGPEEVVAQEAAKIAKEKYGITVKLVKFSDYNLPNAALAAKKIDLNAFQHVPYLKQQEKDRGYKLVVVGNTFTYPIGAYSKKYDSIAQIPNGVTIAMPNDPTNLGRSLLLLQKEGFIKLKNPEGLTQGINDIVSNPHKFKFTTLDANLVPRAVPQVGFAIINGTYAIPNGFIPGKNSLFVEGKDSPYVNVIVSRVDNQHDQDVIDFVKAFQTDEVYKISYKVNGGNIIKGW